MNRLPTFLIASLALPTAAALAVTQGSFGPVLGSGSSSSSGGANGAISTPSLAGIGGMLPGGLAGTGGQAPSRIVKFVDLSFVDPSSWSCSKETETLGGDLLKGQVLSNGCMDCTNSGSGSGDVTVTKPSDATQETISAGSGGALKICQDVLTVTADASGTTGTSTSTPTTPPTGNSAASGVSGSASGSASSTTTTAPSSEDASSSMQ